MTSPGDLYANMASLLQQKLAFAAWRTPGSSTLSMVFQEDRLSHRINDYSESGFVFARFKNEESPLFIPAMQYHQCVVDQNSGEGIIGIAAQNQEAGKNDHLQLVSNGVNAIKKDRFKKVVLSRREEIKLSSPNSILIFRKLLAAYPSAFCYLWFHPETGLWLGATPETLLHVKNNHFTTMALAGTQPYNGHIEVSWGEKEREEQQLVTDFITEQLRPIAKELKLSEVYTTRAGNLLHLRTDIEGTFRNEGHDIKDKTANTGHLIQLLHPTPAVCGHPRDAARQFILENERYDRAFYAGFLGALNMAHPGNTEQASSIYVNLRCMQLQGNRASLYVGGGITRDSIPENEWQETMNKARTIRNIFKEFR